MRLEINFYFEVCEKEGKQPKKKYNEKVLFRFPGKLHARIAKRSEIEGKSINEFGKEVFEKAASEKIP